MNTKAMILDYGGVVADHYCEPATSRLAETLGVDRMVLESLVSERSLHGRAFRLDQISPEQFWRAIDNLRPRGAPAFSWDEAQRLWAESYVPNTDVLAIMQQARQSGWSIGVFSNMDRWRTRHVSGLLDWSVYCDAFICSSEIGSMKPERDAYLAAVTRLGCRRSPNGVVFVDDRVEHVSAAIAAGCQGLLFESADALAARTIGPYRR